MSPSRQRYSPTATDRRVPSAWRTASSESSSVGNATASSAMGRAGQPSARFPCWVLLVFSMGCSTCLSHCSLDFSPRGLHDVRLAAWSAASKASCSQEPRYKTSWMKNVGVPCTPLRWPPSTSSCHALFSFARYLLQIHLCCLGNHESIKQTQASPD